MMIKSQLRKVACVGNVLEFICQFCECVALTALPLLLSRGLKLTRNLGNNRSELSGVLCLQLLKRTQQLSES